VGTPPPVAKSYPHSSQNRSLAGVPQSGQGVPPAETDSSIVPVGRPPGGAGGGAAAGAPPIRSPHTSQ
jgi:hypothetical protein